MEIRFTSKQIDILRVIHAGNEDSSLCTVYEIIDKLSYEVKRDALLHSVKILVDAGYIDRSRREMRDGKSLRVFMVTSKAAEIL